MEWVDFTDDQFRKFAELYHKYKLTPYRWSGKEWMVIVCGKISWPAKWNLVTAPQEVRVDLGIKDGDFCYLMECKEPSTGESE